MAQSGYTPIKLYYSATTTNQPLAADLAPGELAINTADGKLFYEDSSGSVQVIGWKTTPASAGGTGITSYAVGDLLYASGTTTLSKLADTAVGNVLTSGGVGVAPAWAKVALGSAVSGTLPASNGGTGITSYAVGDLLYASGTTTLAKLADTAVGNVLTSGGVGVAPTWAKVALGSAVSGTLPLANGGTNATSAPAAMASLMGFTTTATAAGTTTLVNTSSFYQQFTGVTTQTVTLPVTSTLTTGWTFHIVNNSTGNVTVNSSGANLVITVLPGTTAMCTCIGTTLATAADWEAGLTDFSTATGTGAVVLGTSPTIATPAITFSTAATVTAGTNAQGQGALTNDYNVVTTATANPSGVTLPTAAVGRRIVIVNKGANPINIYPASGGTIDALAANAAISLPVGGTMEFNASTTTLWYSTYNLYTTSDGYATTLTAAGTTTLTSLSGYKQYFTGSTTQTVVLPVVTTLALGRSYEIVNNSTGVLTVNSSGANLVSTVPAGMSGVVTCIAITGTTAASWHFEYTSYDAITGSGAAVFANSPTLVTPTLGTPNSGNFSTGTFTWPTFNQNTSGTAAGLSATLVIANGGTNSTATPTNGGVSYGTGSAYAFSAAGTSGQILTSAGAAAPTWSAVTGTGSVVKASSPTIATAILTGANTIQGLTIGLGGGAVATNTALGISALAANTTGDISVAVGANALAANLTGSSNVAIGNFTMFLNTAGNFNTAVGRNAMVNSTGSNNTCIGAGAGEAMTTGYQNVILGSYDGSAAPISATGNNWVVLSDGASNVRGAFDSSDNFLVGTTSAATPATASSISVANTFGFKNRIINGAFNVRQYTGVSSGGASTVTSAYVTDRWIAQAQSSGTGVGFTSAVAAATLPSGGSQNALTVTQNAALGTLLFVGQRIEANALADLYDSTVTLSYYVSTSASADVGYAIYYAGTTADTWQAVGVGNSIATGAALLTSSGSISTNTSLALKTITFSLGTTAPTRGIEIFIYVNASNGQSITVTGMQLEKGGAATAFDYRPYSTELTLASRYFGLYGTVVGASTFTNPIVPRTAMRTNATVSAVSVASGTGAVYSFTSYGAASGFGAAYQSTAHSGNSQATFTLNSEL